MAEMAKFRKAGKLGQWNCSELGVGEMDHRKGTRGNCRDRSETQNSKAGEIKKRKIKQGKLTENIPKRDKMAEMAKFRKAENRAGEAFKTWGRRKGSSKGHMGVVRIEAKPKNRKRTKLKSGK